MASNSSLSTSQVAKAIDVICSLVFPTEQEGSSHSRLGQDQECSSHFRVQESTSLSSSDRNLDRQKGEVHYITQK